MYYHTYRSIILYCLLTISVVVNVLLICPSILLEYKINIIGEKCKTQNPMTSLNDGKEFAINSWGWIKNGWKHFLPKHRGSPVENMGFIFSGGKVGTYRPYMSSEEMWLQLAIYQNAILRCDDDMKSQVQNTFDNRISECEISQMSQSQIGMLAIEIFKETKDDKYKAKATEVYDFLKKKYNATYGINWSSDLIEVDENGMIVPFLTYYTETFNDSTAYQMALKNIDYYAIHGTDRNTGLPAHAINSSEPFMKIGELNWGRGVSWWVIGLSYINIKDLSLEAQGQIEKLDKTLFRIWEQDGMFTTLIRQSHEQDLSATIPIVFYLATKGKIEISSHLADSFTVYIHDGYLMNCSGPKDGLTLSNFNQPNPLAHAFLLFLVNERIKESFL